MGIISLGGTVISKTIRFGGGDLDRAIMQYINQCFWFNGIRANYNGY